MKHPTSYRWLVWLMMIGMLLLIFPRTLFAQSNQVLGEVELAGAGKLEKASGVWVDGQYVGYLKELKGSKKILLLPGEHEIAVRQDGYHDFSEKITVRAGEKQTVAVKLVKDPSFIMPAVTSEIKLNVTPDRAAVFVDGLYAGHVGEFGGAGKALLVAPGHRKITISLTGYSAFNTEVDLVPNQKFEIKTELTKGTSVSAP
jgi:PEGA domain